MNGKRHILAVDDDPFYGDLYRQILEPKGFSVAIAMDPAAGYAEAEKKPPSLMILDVMMPESGRFRDGFGLLEALRREGKTAALPVVMISALGNEDDVKHGMDLGATDFLPKQDLTPKALLALIEKILGK